MATNVAEENKTLKDLIVSKIVAMGCACSTDLATQIGGGMKPGDLIDPLESLVKAGVLRHKQDPTDPRRYTEREQTVYELDK